MLQVAAWAAAVVGAMLLVLTFGKLDCTAIIL